MATSTTPNFSFIKPDGDEDKADYPTQQNSNIDTVDSELGTLRNKGMQLVATTELDSDSLTISLTSSQIPTSGYRHLMGYLGGQITVGGFDYSKFRLNQDFSSNYHYSATWLRPYLTGTKGIDSGSGATSFRLEIAGSTWSSFTFYIYDFLKNGPFDETLVTFHGQCRYGSGGTEIQTHFGGGCFDVSGAITDIRFVNETDTWRVGSYLKLYGIP